MQRILRIVPLIPPRAKNRHYLERWTALKDTQPFNKGDRPQDARTRHFQGLFRRFRLATIPYTIARRAFVRIAFPSIRRVRPRFKRMPDGGEMRTRTPCVRSRIRRGRPKAFAEHPKGSVTVSLRRLDEAISKAQLNIIVCVK